MLVATFQSPGAYQGGQLTWSIGLVGSSTPLFGGPVNMTQWDMGPVNVNNINLEEFYENFSLGAGVSLAAGNYYVHLSDPAPTPDRFGIFWATNDTGVAFSLEGTGNQGPGGQTTTPEPSTWLAAVGGIGMIVWRKRAIRNS